ncbi:hypothetical protein [Streptomyces gilvosporeus]|uniref:Uncharacterized protein n=1 Tax=Streptomyces gilvosporeus TaxID=553510 RepID=A0A1V0TTB8_9ACTN|nr:hypothetical protein [Streptomyces gilvosporeus]ARF56008.1 hypothetical protein B1H19_19070 [Streptomyces gilvosporeus]
MTGPDPTDIALELAELRGSVEAGFARLDGRFDLLAQRHDQTDRRLAEHDNRLDQAEQRRWPLPSVAALVALAALALSAWEITH